MNVFKYGIKFRFRTFYPFGRIFQFMHSIKGEGGDLRIQNESKRGLSLNLIWQYFHTEKRSDVRLLKQTVKMKAPSKRTLHEAYDKSIMYWCIPNARSRNVQLEFKFHRKRNWVMDLYRMTRVRFNCLFLFLIRQYKNRLYC